MKMKLRRPVRDQVRVAKKRNLSALIGLLGAHAISQTGNVVTAFAVPFYVLGTGGSGTEVGLAAFFATAPIIIGGGFGGVFLDRVDRRRAAIVADLISGGAVLAVPLLALSVGLPFWGLLALVFLAGLLDTPGQTARRVMLPELGARADVPLERSVGFLDGSERLAKLVGASLAGLLVAMLGPVAALFVNVATFAFSGALTWLLVPSLESGTRGGVRAGSGAGADGAGVPGLPDAPGAQARPCASYWAELGQGLKFIVQDPLLRLIVALVMVTNLFDAARASSLMPLYADAYLGGAGALGLLVAVMAGSALVGNVLFGFVARRLPRRVTFGICFLLGGGPPFLVFALNMPFSILLGVTALSGLASGALNPILGAVQLERVPDHMRGRVFGLTGAGAWAGVPMGALLGGVAADLVGISVAFGAIGVLYLVVTTSPFFGGSWRLMERGG